jgi:hypothetical protein
MQQQPLQQPPLQQPQRGSHIQERVGGGRAAAQTYTAPPTAPPPVTNGGLPYNDFGLSNGAQHSGAATYNVQYAPPASAPPDAAPNAPQSQPVTSPAPSMTRFAISNLHAGDELDMPPPAPAGAYLSATEEKNRLKAAMGQAPAPAQSSSQSAHTPANARVSQQATPHAGGQDWLSAEEEKKKLYEKAKADAERAQRKAANMSTGGSTKPSPKGSQVSCIFWVGYRQGAYEYCSSTLRRITRRLFRLGENRRVYGSRRHY